MVIDIKTTALSFRVDVNNKGELVGTHLTVMEYTKKLTHWIWDRQNNRYLLGSEFFKYDARQNICYFPRYELAKFKEFLDNNNVKYVVNEIKREKGRHVEFMMLPHVSYKNDKQKNAVAFLTNAESGPIRGLALQTGVGKTVSYIWALANLQRRSMTVMTSRLEQWVKEILAYTSMDEDDIYVIQGVGSLTKLFNLIDKDLKPKIILGSSKTIRLYLEYGPTYQHLPHPSQMCEKLGIGIVGTDEYHEHFYTNFLVGLILNPAVHMPITATFSANDPFIKKIFDQFIPKNVQFTGGDYDKFVEVYSYMYTGGGYLLKPYAYMSPRGYSQQVFEKWLMTRGRKLLDPLIEDAIIPIIREHYINVAEEGERFLFLCASTKLCDHLVNIFSRVFNSKTVTAFYSGIPESVLSSFDIILSTPGSAGTGRDVKKLRTCFIFENVDAPTRNLQFIGRLRGPPQMMNTPRFITLGLSAIPAHVRYANSRALLYGPRSIKFLHRSIS